jgi:hypothetical protein
MRFIEIFFGLSPDNNSGATETAIVLAILAGMAAVWQLARRIKANRRDACL